MDADNKRISSEFWYVLYFLGAIELMIRWIEIWQKEYLIIANYEVLLKLVDWATEHEKIISFNLSAVFLVEGNKDVYEKVISNTDIVFGNEDESSALGYFINLRYCININYIGI